MNKPVLGAAMLATALSVSACDREDCFITDRTPEGNTLNDPKEVIDSCEEINSRQHEAHEDLITCFAIPSDDDRDVQTIETDCHDYALMDALNRTFPEIRDDARRFCIGRGGANIKCQ